MYSDRSLPTAVVFTVPKVLKTLRALIVGLTVIYASNAMAQEAATTAEPDKYADTAYPAVNYGSGEQAERIKHGEYLAKAGDCIACHTTPGGAAFAGGLAMETPFGTIFSPNITPDKNTGIGTWTDAEFDKAVRQGIAPDGSFYFPVFPYPYFNKLSKQDVLDIRAYLNSIPAVKQANKPLDMPFPFRWRQLQSFWRFMFFDFHKGQYVNDNRRAPDWNRGAYLVQGLGHCSMCHSPLNPLGAPILKYEFAGGFIEGYRAPNISASGLKDIPTQQVLDVFLKDKLIHGGDVQGPMLQVNHDSLRYMSVEDLNAIVTYLRTVNSKVPPAPKIASGPEAGKGIYEQYCAGCHNNGGGGAPKLGNAADWQPRVDLGMPQLYQNAINGIGGMPPKGTCTTCNDDQVKAAVDYILAESTGASAKATEATGPTPQQQTSLARGKEVYDRVCSICHNNGLLGAPILGNKVQWDSLLKLNLDVLVERSIDGYKNHPPRGACYNCSDADIIAAVKYMAQQSGTGNYTLW
jgi:cytochrome c5